MSSEKDGDDIAPVIPLFGRTTRPARGDADGAPAARTFPVRRIPAAESGDGASLGTPSDDAGAAEGGSPGAHREAAERGADEAGAPGGAPGEAEGEEWHTTWRALGREGGLRPAPRLETVQRDGVRFVELPDAAATGVPEASGDEVVEKAEQRLLRSLGSRGLSVSEARTKLRRLDVPVDAIDEVVDRLERSGALDDDALAEQIVYQASTHRNEGRKAIAQSLQKRGIARDTIDRVVAELPDDDYERALDFARTKARQLARYDDDTALRRLVGQLSRRGYGGLAMSVARRALDEQGAPAPHRVRFE